MSKESDRVSEHFLRGEFACKCGCGFAAVDVELLKILEKLRKRFESPVEIHSGCRCVEWNKKVGGKPKSQHLRGLAADVVVKGVQPRDVYEFLDSLEVPGLGKYDTFTHVDVRMKEGKARW